MRFAVFGAGGVGGYLGARLADAGHDVSLIARGEHLAALRTDGCRVESIHGDTSVTLPATDVPTDIGECDFVLFCVKATDTKEAATQLEPLLAEQTGVVSFQNGVDNEEWLAESIGRDHVIGGVAYIFSTIKEPGIIAHTGGPARFIYGELNGHTTPRIERFDEAFSASPGVEAVLVDDIDVERWRKFVFICAQAGMTATTRRPLGDIRTTDATWRMYRRVMDEVAAVARAKGIKLPADTIEDWVSFAHELEPDTYSSLHYDLTHDKRLELDALNGSVVRHAAEVGVDVPMNEAITAILRPSAEAGG